MLAPRVTLPGFNPGKVAQPLVHALEQGSAFSHDPFADRNLLERVLVNAIRAHK